MEIPATRDEIERALGKATADHIFADAEYARLSTALKEHSQGENRQRFEAEYGESAWEERRDQLAAQLGQMEGRQMETRHQVAELRQALHNLLHHPAQPPAAAGE